MVDYCIECDDFTEYSYSKEEKKKVRRGKAYKYRIDVPRCSICNSVMPIHGQIDLEVEAFFKVYNKENGKESNPMLNINEFIKEVGKNNVEHGFRDADLKSTDFVALIHSEVSEILEEFRAGHEATETYYREDGKPEGVPAELADVVIRCFDMADYYGIDLESAILEKHEFNKTRPYKHGKKF